MIQIEGIEMGTSVMIPFLFALVLPVDPPRQVGTPSISSVEPASGRVGDVLTAHGVNLGLDCVADLFLTDGKNDIKVPIVEQTATSIRFKIPTQAKGGRFTPMVLTKGQEAKLIEQALKIMVDSDEP
jgi:hypothetical protein